MPILFPLDRILEKFKHYYMDINMEVYTDRDYPLRQFKKVVLSNFDTITIKGIVHRVDSLKNFVEKTNEWKTWVLDHQQKDPETHVVEEKQYIIGCCESEEKELVFNNNPKIHTNEESATKEAERLLMMNPSRKFIIFEKKKTCSVSYNVVWQ